MSLVLGKFKERRARLILTSGGMYNRIHINEHAVGTRYRRLKVMEKDMQNEQAQELIQKSEELRQSLKETVLCHLLDCLNTICKEQNLQYFAISRLLAQQITGKDTFPDNTVYNICMMRKDYDRFFQAAQAQKKKLGMKRQIH